MHMPDEPVYAWQLNIPRWNMHGDRKVPLSEQFCTLSEAAVRLGVERHTLTRWAKTGQLPVERIGGVVLVEKGVIERLRQEGRCAMGTSHE